jgi:hypothetical protein
MHILLKELLSETPDKVFVAGPPHMYKWDAPGEIYTFFTFPRYSLVMRNSSHSGILHVVAKIYDTIVGVEDSTAAARNFTNKMLAENRMRCSNVDEFIKDCQGGIMHDAIKEKGSHELVYSATSFREDSRLLCGRIWVDDKIISCWCKLDDLRNKWGMIKQLFKDAQELFGNLDEYRVDNLERDALATKTGVIPDLFPAKDVEDSKVGDEEISPEQILDLRKKLHVLPPDEKKRAMKKLGMININKNRDVKANYHQDAIAEGVILLKSLL